MTEKEINDLIYAIEEYIKWWCMYSWEPPYYIQRNLPKRFAISVEKFDISMVKDIYSIIRIKDRLKDFKVSKIFKVKDIFMTKECNIIAVRTMAEELAYKIDTHIGIIDEETKKISDYFKHDVTAALETAWRNYQYKEVEEKKNMYRLTTNFDFASFYPIEKIGAFAFCLKPKKVIFNNPATIVYWPDGSKTIVKCQDGDTFDPEKGLALCYMKKCLGNKGNYNDIIKKYINNLINYQNKNESY